MLGFWQPHAQFQQFLTNELAARWPNDQQRIEHYASLLEAAWLLDLDLARPILAPHYSLTGRPSNQAPAVLRSLLLMTFAVETSISAWHDRLSGEPILAIACGFQPDDIASVATIYYLRNLLWPRPCIPALRRLPKKPVRPAKRGDKLPNKHPAILGSLFDEAKNGRRFSLRPERFLQELMARVVVDTSVKKGLLGNPNSLSVAIDGAPLQTGASPYGKRICECQLAPGQRCDCPRSFEDAAANWGWDSFHKQYYFGHTLYHTTAADSLYDLPFLVRLTQASRNDSVTGFISLVETVDLYPQLTIKRVLADSAHDNAPTYIFCYEHHMAPYIDANKRHQGQPLLPSPTGFTVEGVPICPAGELMISNGFCSGRNRHKYRCPHLGECATPCSSSSYGRVVYTYPKGSLRQPPVPRNTEAFRRVYKRRTTVERSLKRTLVDRHLEDCRVRRKNHWYWCAILAAMAQHVDAWIADRLKQGISLLGWLKTELLIAA